MIVFDGLEHIAQIEILYIHRAGMFLYFSLVTLEELSRSVPPANGLGTNNDIF